jgi:hypothetical protein
LVFIFLAHLAKGHVSFCHHLASWTIDELSIFSNGSHLEWRAGLSDTILKGTHPMTIPARFGLIWFRGFRGEDLNVKVYDARRMPNDGKSSHGLILGFSVRFFQPVYSV